MWLVGVVIRRYIDILIIIINFPYSTCIRSFFGSSILTSLFIFKCFFGLVYIYMTKIFPHCTISVGLAPLAIERASNARESRDFHVRGTE